MISDDNLHLLLISSLISLGHRNNLLFAALLSKAIILSNVYNSVGVPCYIIIFTTHKEEIIFSFYYDLIGKK